MLLAGGVVLLLLLMLLTVEVGLPWLLVARSRSFSSATAALKAGHPWYLAMCPRPQLAQHGLFLFCVQSWIL